LTRQAQRHLPRWQARETAVGVVEVPKKAVYVGNDDYIFNVSVYENVDL